MISDTFDLISSMSKTVSIRVVKGHFATKHSHVSHFIDMTKVKSEMTSARDAANMFADRYRFTPVDTVITLERTKMIGGFIAEELNRAGVNAGHDVAVITPEITDEKMILRDNLVPYVKNRHVLLLTATATTGMTLCSALEGILYYGGTPVGAATVFGGDFGEGISVQGNLVPVERLFFAKDIGKYFSYGAHDCPLCRAGEKVDALINSYGYSKL